MIAVRQHSCSQSLLSVSSGACRGPGVPRPRCPPSLPHDASVAGARPAITLGPVPRWPRQTGPSVRPRSRSREFDPAHRVEGLLPRLRADAAPRTWRVPIDGSASAELLAEAGLDLAGADGDRCREDRRARRCDQVSHRRDGPNAARCHRPGVLRHHPAGCCGWSSPDGQTLTPAASGSSQPDRSPAAARTGPAGRVVG